MLVCSPGGDHLGTGAPSDHHGARVHAIAQFGERFMAAAAPGGVLVHRQGFARQQRFVDFQALCAQQLRIGGNPCAGFQFDGVAGHELLGRNVQHLTVAHHGRADLQELMQGAAAAISACLLPATDQRIDEQRGEDEQRVVAITGRRSEHGRHQQHINERTAKLPQDDCPDRGGRGLRQDVGAVLREPARRLGTAQPGEVGLGHGRQGDIDGYASSIQRVVAASCSACRAFSRSRTGAVTSQGWV